MNLKLTNTVFDIIVEGLLTEAAKGPLAAFEDIIKLAGRNLIAANSALLFALKKVNPEIRQLYRATDDEIGRAMLKKEFSEYRKIISVGLYKKFEAEIDLVFKKADLSTIEGKTDAAMEITRKTGIREELSAEIVKMKSPKTTKTVTPKVKVNDGPPFRPEVVIPNLETVVSNPSRLWDTFKNELKTYKLTSNLTKEQGELFVKEIRGMIQKEYQKNGQKLDVSLDNLKKVYDNLQPTQQKQFLEQTVKNIKELGIKGSISAKTAEVLSNGISSLFRGKNLDFKNAKTYIYLSTAVSLIHDTLRLFEDKEAGADFKGHFGQMDLGPTIAFKSGVLWLSSHFPNAIVALLANAVLVLDSMYRYWSSADVRAAGKTPGEKKPTWDKKLGKWVDDKGNEVKNWAGDKMGIPTVMEDTNGVMAWAESEKNPLGLTDADFTNIRYELTQDKKSCLIYLEGVQEPIKIANYVGIGFQEIKDK